MEKLEFTKDVVSKLNEKLVELQPMIVTKKTEVEDKMIILAEDQKVADEKEIECTEEEKENSIVSENVQSIKDECQKDLDSALPA